MQKSYIAKLTVFFADVDVYIREGDVCVHSPLENKLTIYRGGEILKTCMRTTQSIESMCTLGWMKPHEAVAPAVVVEPVVAPPAPVLVVVKEPVVEAPAPAPVVVEEEEKEAETEAPADDEKEAEAPADAEADANVNAVDEKTEEAPAPKKPKSKKK